MARAVRALLERLAATRPVTVLLDDVHWADPASVDVIALLLHRPPEGARAARAGRADAGALRRVEDALHAAARHDGAELLELEPLSREAAERCCRPRWARRRGRACIARAAATRSICRR